MLTGEIKQAQYVAQASPTGAYQYATHGVLEGLNGSRIERGGGLFERDSKANFPAGVVPIVTHSFDFAATKASFTKPTRIVGAKSVVIKDCTISNIGSAGIEFENCNNIRIERPQIIGDKTKVNDGAGNYGIVLKNCRNVTIVSPSIQDCHIGLLFTGDCSGIYVEYMTATGCHKALGLHGGSHTGVQLYGCTGYLELGSPQWPTKVLNLKVDRQVGNAEVNGLVKGSIAFNILAPGTVFTRAVLPPGATEYLTPNVDIFEARMVRAMEFLH